MTRIRRIFSVIDPTTATTRAQLIENLPRAFREVYGLNPMITGEALLCDLMRLSANGMLRWEDSDGPKSTNATRILLRALYPSSKGP